MQWIVKFHNKFEKEFAALEQEVQDELLAHALLLEKVGPHLGRPYADTLKGSKFSNMKELRFKVNNGVWRVVFAFDTECQAILLIAGDKSVVKEKRFYKELIRKADECFSSHLCELVKEE